jgi:NifU-like protein involved in Fe-S cluster formation/TusA-related sulfurtransferase
MVATVTTRRRVRGLALDFMAKLQHEIMHDLLEQEVWDVGQLGCGELVLERRGRLSVMPGRVLRVIAFDPGAPEELPAWCRLTGHTLRHGDRATHSYWIEARPAKAAPATAGVAAPRASSDEIYSAKIFALAEALPPPAHLAHPDATATAHSKLCGSTAAVDLVVRDSAVHAFTQRIQACLLGRATASVVAQAIVGAPVKDVRQAAASMRDMLADGETAPSGRWSDLAALAPIKDLKGRHPSTLLVFVAVERALDAVSNT